MIHLIRVILHIIVRTGEVQMERLVDAASVFIASSSQHIDCDCNQCKLKAALEPFKEVS